MLRALFVSQVLLTDRADILVLGPITSIYCLQVQAFSFVLPGGKTNMLSTHLPLRPGLRLLDEIWRLLIHDMTILKNPHL